MALILPILDYGDFIYRIATKSLLSKLDVIYHSAIRFVTGAPYDTHHCDLYSLVQWPSLHTRRQIHWLSYIYKSMIGKTPPYLSSLLNIATKARISRSSKFISLELPPARIAFGRLSFQYSAASDWNELQKTLKLESLISLPCLNKRLHDIITDDDCSCYAN